MLEEMTKCSSDSTIYQCVVTHLSVCSGRVTCRAATSIWEKGIRLEAYVFLNLHMAGDLKLKATTATSMPLCSNRSDEASQCCNLLFPSPKHACYQSLRNKMCHENKGKWIKNMSN